MDVPGGEAVRDILEEARDLGFLGPGAVDAHVAHSTGFAAAVGGPFPARFLDLGSGGGVPGLILAQLWPDAAGLLLDASARRAGFLQAACERLGIAHRVGTLQARAEDAARRPDLRGAFDLVTARAFGPPAVTAECGVGFLGPGARLAVSEPPDSSEVRWPAESLARLGLGPATIRRTGGVSVAVITRQEAPASRWPRRTGIPAKRPLWH